MKKVTINGTDVYDLEGWLDLDKAIDIAINGRPFFRVMELVLKENGGLVPKWEFWWLCESEASLKKDTMHVRISKHDESDVRPEPQGESIGSAWIKYRKNGSDGFCRVQVFDISTPWIAPEDINATVDEYFDEETRRARYGLFRDA